MASKRKLGAIAPSTAPVRTPKKNQLITSSFCRELGSSSTPPWKRQCLASGSKEAPEAIASSGASAVQESATGSNRTRLSRPTSCPVRVPERSYFPQQPDPTCPICFVDYGEMENGHIEQPLCLRCGHFIGTHCREKILKQKGTRRAKCPFCRKRLVDHDYYGEEPPEEPREERWLPRRLPLSSLLTLDAAAEPQQGFNGQTFRIRERLIGGVTWWDLEEDLQSSPEHPRAVAQSLSATDIAENRREAETQQAERRYDDQRVAHESLQASVPPRPSETPQWAADDNFLGIPTMSWAELAAEFHGRGGDGA